MFDHVERLADDCVVDDDDEGGAVVVYVFFSSREFLFYTHQYLMNTSHFAVVNPDTMFYSSWVNTTQTGGRMHVFNADSSQVLYTLFYR